MGEDACPVQPDGRVQRAYHAILIVGYGTNEHGIDYWKVKNSWSTNYGDGGYFYLRRGNNSAPCGLFQIPFLLPMMKDSSFHDKPFPPSASVFKNPLPQTAGFSQSTAGTDADTSDTSQWKVLYEKANQTSRRLEGDGGQTLDSTQDLVMCTKEMGNPMLSAPWPVATAQAQYNIDGGNPSFNFLTEEEAETAVANANTSRKRYSELEAQSPPGSLPDFQ